MAKIKMKSMRSARRRFRITGTGKVLRTVAGKGHLLTGKRRAVKLKKRGTILVASVDCEKIRKIFPYGT